MKPCARCGTQNADESAVCSACGAALPALGLGGTLIAAPPEGAAGAKNLRGTMLGIGALPASPPPPGDARPFSGTVSLGSVPSSTPPAPSLPPVPEPPAAPAPRLGATMLGIAPPASAPAGALSSLEGAPKPPLASQQKTVLGVARPGIAPLNPGLVKAPAVPAEAPLVSPPPPPPPPPAPAFEPSLPRAVPPRRSRALLFVAATALLVGAATLGGLWWLRSGTSVTARATVNSEGRDQLELVCSVCEDDTRVWSDSEQARFRAGQASLPLPAPLSVGDNRLMLGLERPGKRREQIALSVPVEYRVRASTDPFTRGEPKLSLVATALPGSTLVVDGKPVALDAGGRAELELDVEAELRGPAPTVEPFARRIDYVLTPAGGAPQRGSAEVRLGIAPLLIDAPGDAIVVSEPSVTVAGRTAPGSRVTVGGAAATLDEAGRFAHAVALSGTADQAIEVRTALDGHAPRLVTVRARRSDDLNRDLALARSRAAIALPAAVAAGEGAVGKTLVVEGAVFDFRFDGYSSVVLLDVASGCRAAAAPCLVKVVYGARRDLSKGQKLAAFGTLSRLVDGPRTGQRIPELRAEMLVPGAT